MVVGVVHILYGLAMALWTFWPILVVLIGMVTALADGQMDAALANMMLIIIPVLQVLAYVIMIALGAVAIFGGLKMRSASSKGIIYAGVGGAAGAPFLGLGAALVNVLNFAGGCCCCGIGISGGLALPGLLGGIGVAAWTVMTLGDEQVAAAFEANAASAE